MGLCWPLEMPATPKIVLISLADQANDAGICWPSVVSICRRTCLAERTVQGAIRWLKKAGLVSIESRNGRSTIYTICPDCYTQPQQQVHPRSRCTPAESATPPPQNLPPTPAARAPRTVSEPSSEPVEAKEATAPPSGSPATVVKKSPKRGTRLPEDWELETEWGRWAEKERRWPPDRIVQTAERFKDFWISKPGTAGLKLDWFATWRNWVRNERAN